MFRRETFNATSHTQSGSVVIEASIVIFAIAIFCVALLELGRGLDTYYRMIQVGRDSVRLGAWLGNFQRNTRVTTRSFPDGVVTAKRPLTWAQRVIGGDGQETWMSGPGFNGGAEALLIHDRATTLSSLLTKRIDPASVRISTQATDTLLTVDIFADYQPVVGFPGIISAIPLHIQVTGPLATPGSGLQISGGDVNLLQELYEAPGWKSCDIDGCVEPPVAANQLSNGVWVGLIAQDALPAT